MRIVTLMVWLMVSLTANAGEALIAVNDHRFEVELAVTPAEREVGLMYRTELAPNRGMLFVYPDPQRVSFWMKQTLIPLDILFFDGEGRLVQSYANVQPCRRDPCRNYSNEIPAQYVLEVAAGTAERLSIKLGNRLEILKQ